MKNFFYKSFWINNIEVTVKEIILGFSIIFILLTIGIDISNKIHEHKLDADKKYNTAIKINNDEELFTYGMKTNIGYAFVYGPLKAVDTVSDIHINGEYMYLVKNVEIYTRHTRTVNEYDEEGNVIGSHEEEYWTWDTVNIEKKHSKQIQFLNNIFDFGIIDIPNEYYINTIKVKSDTRYVYYGVDTEHIGTIFTELKDNTISSCKFYKDMDIYKTLEYLTGMDWRILFWIFWLGLICGIIFIFIQFENKWMK